MALIMLVDDDPQMLRLLSDVIDLDGHQAILAEDGEVAINYFKDQTFGHLVGITSVASLVGNRHVPAYHASKGFQSSYLESLWMKARKTKKASITITNILPGYIDTDIITGPTFWMASLDKAVPQIYSAIKKKKRKAYITKRWRLVALMMRIVPPQILMKFL